MFSRIFNTIRGWCNKKIVAPNHSDHPIDEEIIAPANEALIPVEQEMENEIFEADDPLGSLFPASLWYLFIAYLMDDIKLLYEFNTYWPHLIETAYEIKLTKRDRSYKIFSAALTDSVASKKIAIEKLWYMGERLLDEAAQYCSYSNRSNAPLGENPDDWARRHLSLCLPENDTVFLPLLNKYQGEYLIEAIKLKMYILKNKLYCYEKNRSPKITSKVVKRTTCLSLNLKEDTALSSSLIGLFSRLGAQHCVFTSKDPSTGKRLTRIFCNSENQNPKPRIK